MHSLKLLITFKYTSAVNGIRCCIVTGFRVSSYNSTTSMEGLLDPPKLHGTKVLDKNAFRKIIKVPTLRINYNQFRVVAGSLTKYILKCHKLKNIEEVDGTYKILFDPLVIKTWNNFEEPLLSKFKECGISINNFTEISIELGYDNWPAAALLKAVLPEGEPPLTSYSFIGHIIHINISNHLWDFKHIIAEILLDKTTYAKTVVCKKNIIDNVYRNFEMELLCGEPNYVTTTKENGCVYTLDFSKVYWNPRLSTEHDRIVKIVKPFDVLFDVFAGIGPFSIPAAKKKCFTYANDLNPESFKWLNFNVTQNKKSVNYINTYNKEGSDFILTDIKENLIKRWQDPYFCGKIHVVMNLPAIALNFISNFKGLILEEDLKVLEFSKVKNNTPIIHCYFFLKVPQTCEELFENTTELCLKSLQYSFHFVRSVSNGKDMMRITFIMPVSYLLKNQSMEAEGPHLKKLRSE